MSARLTVLGNLQIAMEADPQVRTLIARGLVFSVTSGRSGTRLMTMLLRDAGGFDADHEPEPRVNHVLPRIIQDPGFGLSWLAQDKIPAIARRAGGSGPYIETSHLMCKGLIEPLFALGLRPRFILLSRPIEAIASSLFKMNVIPGRTPAGRLVLIAPSDPGVLPMPGWEQFSDYQLCYWYALEIERRQRFYAGHFTAHGIDHHWISLEELTQWDGFRRLCAFLDPESLARLDRERFDALCAVNQHPRDVAHPGGVDRPLPEGLETQEWAVLEACAPYSVSVALRLAAIVANAG
jgi:hypothetical protein